MSEQPEPPKLRVSFLMDQIAGHITNYHNIRRVVDADPTIEATWIEVEYHKEGRALERWSARLHVPTYVSGVLRGSLEMRRGLRRTRPDVYFCNTSIAAFFSRSLAKTPTLYDTDATPSRSTRCRPTPARVRTRSAERIKRAINTRLFTSVGLIQAWSHWAKDSYVDDYGVDPARTFVNPPGIDLDRWRRPSDRPRRDGPPARAVRRGRLRPQGRRTAPSRGPRRSRPAPSSCTPSPVTRSATPNVVVHRGLGPNSPELVERYHDADVFVLPSLGECFGIATVEAMAAGLPVVASDTGGTADIVADGVNGFIVTTGDLDSLTTALDRLVADPELCRSMGSRSAELAQERFDLTSNVRRTIEQMRRLATTASPRR